MGCIKYEVWIDGVCVAKAVELETAFDICKAHQNRYYRETEFKYIIKTANAEAEQTEQTDCPWK